MDSDEKLELAKQILLLALTITLLTLFHFLRG